MPRKLIEKFRRRDGLNLEACTPIRLADGQEWYFPRPMLELNPTFINGDVVHLTNCLTSGSELDLLIQMIAEASEPKDQIAKIMTLGALLLLRNYDLTDDELSKLFILRIRDDVDETQETRAQIMNVATGGLFTAIKGIPSDPKKHAAGLDAA